MNIYKNSKEFKKLIQLLKPLFKKNLALQSVSFIPKDPARVIKVGWNEEFLESGQHTFLRSVHDELEKRVSPLKSSRGRYIMVKRSEVIK